MKTFLSTIILVLLVTFGYSNELVRTKAYTTKKEEPAILNRHSVQLNVAGLAFERYGITYEYRLAPRHTIMVQGGGSIPFICEEKEYGFGLHYKYYINPKNDAKFLGLFKSAQRSTFLDLNARYMNLDGIHEGAECLFESYFIGAGIGQLWVWKSGFSISYWLGYGPPIGAEFSWKNTVPDDGESWAKMYTNSSGLDFGLSLGYSFGSLKNR